MDSDNLSDIDFLTLLDESIVVLSAIQEGVRSPIAAGMLDLR